MEQYVAPDFVDDVVPRRNLIVPRRDVDMIEAAAPVIEGNVDFEQALGNFGE